MKSPNLTEETVRYYEDFVDQILGREDPGAPTDDKKNTDDDGAPPRTQDTTPVVPRPQQVPDNQEVVETIEYINSDWPFMQIPGGTTDPPPPVPTPPEKTDENSGFNQFRRRLVLQGTGTGGQFRLSDMFETAEEGDSEDENILNEGAGGGGARRTEHRPPLRRRWHGLNGARERRR